MARRHTGEGDPDIAPALLAWWDVHGRKDLPWQQEPTPYRVWVSEVMLQQTQVATVLRYYGRFMAAFPTVLALADATEDAVLHAWSGLGYYRRAHHLQLAARQVRDEHGGILPATLEGLMSLPGIGRSTAGAILALAHGERHPILDGNVKRVLARLHRIEEPPAGAAVLARLWQLADKHTPAVRTAAYTQAIMDLGATVCTRHQPACTRCPLRAMCLAFRAGVAGQLPARRPARPRPLRACAVLLLRVGEAQVLLERRPAGGLWGGLWGLPELDAVDEAAAWCERELGTAPLGMVVHPVLRHGFTHFELDMTPVELRLPAPARLRDDGRWLAYDLRAPARIGLAAPVARLLDALRAGIPGTRWENPAPLP